MSLEIIKTDSGLESLQSDWDRLTSDTLRSFAWHRAWWQHFQEDKQLRIYAYRQDGELVGLLPVFADRWMGQTRLRFIGSGDTCTDYAQVIGPESIHEDFIAVLAEELAQDRSVDMLELEGITPQTAEPFRIALSNCDYWRYQRSLDPTWILDLPNSWKEFISGSKKSLRRKIKKAESRLNSPEIEVKTTRDQLEFDEAFAILVELHQDRFEQQGKPGVFADPRFYGFLKMASEELAAQGKVEIIVAYHEGEPFIAQIYLQHHRGPQLYQQGIRSSKMNLEPGHLLLTYAVKRAIEEGAAKFDMLRGNHAYKPYWGAQPNELCKMRLVSPKLIPSAVNRSYQVLREMKHFCFDLAKETGMRFEESA